MPEDVETEDATSEAETQEQEQGSAETEGSESLGDAGKQALDRMKAERNAERARAREAQRELERIKAELALKDKPAEEQAIEAAKAEARAEATAAANARILKSELKAVAAGKLADPSDAALFIDLSEFSVDENGDVDIDALNDAITSLLERKPHLAAQKPNRFDGSGDQGGKSKSKPSQLSRDDLKRMTPQQIVDAKAAGQLDRLLGFEN
jgi:hypothetical protein